MRNFAYHRAHSLDDARAATARAGAMLLAGGTTLVDLAKLSVACPETVVDISHLSGLDRIDADENGVTIGALAKMSTVAEHPEIRTQFPAIADALWQAASPQLRNMATIGGNLLQRTRCPYFRDPEMFPACNKRVPGTGCSAIGGITRNHAILGISDSCIAAYPGDLAVALVAFDAEIVLGERRVPAEDFFLLPGSTPDREHAIEPGEIVTAIRIPRSAAAKRSAFLKVRDRQSYEFAAASAAVGLDLAEDGMVRDIRVAIGGVATRPWRCRKIECVLKGHPLSRECVATAAQLAIAGAVAQEDNRYKLTLAPRVVARAILNLGEIA
jgi:xanthine dehydrogenase YagS FAD-binding subunit